MAFVLLLAWIGEVFSQEALEHWDELSGVLHSLDVIREGDLLACGQFTQVSGGQFFSVGDLTPFSGPPLIGNYRGPPRVRINSTSLSGG